MFRLARRRSVANVSSYRNRSADHRILRLMNADGPDDELRDSFAMERGVAECNLACLRAPVKQVRVVFPREAHTALHLNTTIANLATRIARVNFCDTDRRARLGNSFGLCLFEGPRRVVCGRSRAFGPHQHV